jgi:uncharacterized protein (TIGR02118 family)
MGVPNGFPALRSPTRQTRGARVTSSSRSNRRGDATGRNLQVSVRAMSVGVRGAVPTSGWVVTQLVTQYTGLRSRVTVLAARVFQGQGEGDTVVKVVVLLPRRSDLSREDFERYLRDTHVPLLVRLPGLRRLVLNWVLPDPNGPAPAYDAVGEDWFDDGQALSAAFASPEGKAVADDTPNFLDMSRFGLLVTEEEEIPLPTSGAG